MKPSNPTVHKAGTSTLWFGSFLTNTWVRWVQWSSGRWCGEWPVLPAWWASVPFSEVRPLQVKDTHRFSAGTWVFSRAIFNQVVQLFKNHRMEPLLEWGWEDFIVSLWRSVTADPASWVPWHRLSRLRKNSERSPAEQLLCVYGSKLGRWVYVFFKKSSFIPCENSGN